MERNWTFKLIRVERREKAFLFQDTKHDLVLDGTRLDLYQDGCSGNWNPFLVIIKRHAHVHEFKVFIKIVIAVENLANTIELVAGCCPLESMRNLKEKVLMTNIL